MCLNGSNDISQRWQYQTIGLATEEPETPSHDCRDMVNIFARISIDVDRGTGPNAFAHSICCALGEGMV
jgi:hypothetical protein